ncbi:TetR-like C-terminal domain-containing protein [Staphylococcus cohnii]
MINTNDYSKTDKHYLTVFLSNAILGIIQEWVNHGQKETPKELSAVLSKIVPKHLFFKDK